MTHTQPLSLTSDQISVTVLQQGAALVGVRFKGSARNLVLGFDNPADHTNVPIYAGALVGPVANRVRGGLVRIDGKSYHMPCNENGHTTLHSGPDGLHARLWEVVEHTRSTLRLRTTLEDGACGLPGRREMSVTYHVDGNVLSLTIEARTDQSTPINIASHAYWNLDGRADISGHHLTVHADKYLPTDKHALPLGPPAHSTQTHFDFATARPVPLTPDLDVNYCLSDASRDVPHPAATLTGADGTRLELATNAPGLQVYSGSFLPQMPGALSEDRDLCQYGAIALEPQHWPDAMHQEAYPSILLAPGQTYRQITTFALSRPTPGI